MKRFTGHQEPWGEFVDVKINAPELLSKEILKKKVGNVWVSGVCDPYQPLEAKYQLTRRCLAILAEHNWPVIVQTRSPLVLRDIDILKNAKNFEVGFSVTTADDSIRNVPLQALSIMLCSKVEIHDKFRKEKIEYSRAHAGWNITIEQTSHYFIFGEGSNLKTV
jgi:hypothetical protein